MQSHESHQDHEGHGQQPASRSESAMDHAAMGHPMSMTPTVTRTQLAAVAFVTVLALVSAFLFSIARYNLTLSAEDVGGLVMPQGMIMNRETTAESMRDMAAVNPH